MKNENKAESLLGATNETGLNALEISDFSPNLLFADCLVDHSGRQYVCTQGHCQDLPSCFRNKLLQKSIDFHELNFHPEDRRLWCEMAFPDILRFVHSETFGGYSDYRFIFNHRYIRKDGSISQFTHEGALTFSDNENMPFLHLNAFSEIADIKSDETMILTIFRYSDEHGYRKVFSKIYNPSQPMILNAQMNQFGNVVCIGFSHAVALMVFHRVNAQI